MQDIAIIALALLLAHLLSDFPFQTEWIADNKGAQIKPTAMHAATHLVLASLCLLVFAPVKLDSLRFCTVTGILVLTHIAQDCAKKWLIRVQRIPDNATVFLGDQFLHVAAVVAAALVIGRARALRLPHPSPSSAAKGLAVAVVYVGVVFGGGYLIRYLTRSLATQISSLQDETSQELHNAGLYIGWLERFLVITGIVIQSPAIVGLILTGKSVARLPELRKQPGFAEYFLIGTLLSITLATLGGLILAKVLYGTASLK